jgi:hypothetical protein
MGFSQKTIYMALFIPCVLLFSPTDLSAIAEELNESDHTLDLALTSPLITNDLDINLILENHRSAIEQKETEVGPYDPELSELTFSLGKTLQTSQRYDEAISTYKRSLYLKRINNGIYSLSQEPILRGIIESHLQQGQVLEASENYNQLLWIHVKTYDENDARLIPLFEEIGQWHLSNYIQTEQREYGNHLNTAFELYSRAIELSTQHHGQYNLELIYLLKNIAITSYYQTLYQRRYPEYAELGASVPFGYRAMGTSGDSLLRRGSYYLYGNSAQNRILEVLANNPDITATDKAIAYTDQGDWYMLYGRYQLAMGAYQQAHQAVKGEQQQKEVIHTLFGTPTMLPKIERRKAINGSPSNNPPSNGSNAPEPKNSIENNSTLIFKNYVNLSVDVTERGVATNLKIQEIHPEGESEFGYRAKRTIRSQKFRPRFENGHPVITNEFPIRVLIPNESS